VVVAVEHTVFRLEPAEPAELVVAVMEAKMAARPLLLVLRILVVVAVAMHKEMEVRAAPVLSSSRPINNEDKWKPKSIGCMESTPQCTC